MLKIMVSDCDHANMDQEDAVIRGAGMEYTKVQCRTEDELIEQCKGGSIFLNQYAPFTRRVMEALQPEIKQIVRYGVGVNNVDVKAATELGIQVCNVPDYGMNEVADQAVALMMALVRKVCLMNEYTRNHWDYSRAVPLYRIPGCTIGIVGVGRIGQTFAKRMSGFDCRIVAYDPAYTKENAPAGVEMVSFEELVTESDMISIHCPLTETSRDMFTLDVFKKMKKTAYIVNTARGGIINEEDLYTALSEGLIAGAGLDVVEVEPFSPDNKLFTLENFLCTPHMAWYSAEAALELKRKVAEEAVRFAKGEPVHYPVNQL